MRPEKRNENNNQVYPMLHSSMSCLGRAFQAVGCGDFDVMNIHLGRTQASMLNPPNEGTVIDGDIEWKIGRNSSGGIVLRDGSKCHPEFIDGMWMSEFVSWINSASMRQPP